MNITILGAAGFIGTNLAFELEKNNKLLLVDERIDFFPKEILSNENISVYITKFNMDTDFNGLLKNQDIVFHLISTINPTSSNIDIGKELQDNVGITVNILEACKNNNIKKVVFLSSGGTVYGKHNCPIDENAENNPINTYGIQKLTIEKVLYLYNYLYGLDYVVARLSNPYGPYQRPNGKLGAVTTFIYKALMHEPINIYGNGENVRDYIYIDDAIHAIKNISLNETKYKIYNIGSGIGRSLKEIVSYIEDVLGYTLSINYSFQRKVDLKENVLDVSRYEFEFGRISQTPIEKGIVQTAIFLKQSMDKGSVS